MGPSQFRGQFVSQFILCLHTFLKTGTLSPSPLPQQRVTNLQVINAAIIQAALSLNAAYVWYLFFYVASCECVCVCVCVFVCFNKCPHSHCRSSYSSHIFATVSDSCRHFNIHSFIHSYIRYSNHSRSQYLYFIIHAMLVNFKTMCKNSCWPPTTCRCPPLPPHHTSSIRCQHPRLMHIHIIIV